MQRAHEFVGTPGAIGLLYSCICCGRRVYLAVASVAAAVPERCASCAATHRALASCFTANDFTTEPHHASNVARKGP